MKAPVAEHQYARLPAPRRHVTRPHEDLSGEDESILVFGKAQGPRVRRGDRLARRFGVDGAAKTAGNLSAMQSRRSVAGPSRGRQPNSRCTPDPADRSSARSRSAMRSRTQPIGSSAASEEFFDRDDGARPAAPEFTAERPLGCRPVGTWTSDLAATWSSPAIPCRLDRPQPCAPNRRCPRQQDIRPCWVSNASHRPRRRRSQARGWSARPQPHLRSWSSPRTAERPVGLRPDVPVQQAHATPVAPVVLAKQADDRPALLRVIQAPARHRRLWQIASRATSSRRAA